MAKVCSVVWAIIRLIWAEPIKAILEKIKDIVMNLMFHFMLKHICHLQI